MNEMTIGALFFCLLICAVGAMCIASPSRLVTATHRYTARTFYFVASLRVMFGITLIFAAPASRIPNFINILGIVVVFSGVVLFLVGYKRFRKFIDWWASHGSAFIRGTGVLAMMIGVALAYALVP